MNALPLTPKGKRKKKSTLRRVVIAVIILLILGALVEGTKNNSTSSSTSSSPQSSSTPSSSSSSSSSPSSSQQKDTQPSGKIGDTVTVGDSAWVITDATPTSQLTDQFGPPKQGNFVTVDFNFTNNGDKAKTLSTPIIKLIDSTGREFSADTDSWSYVPADRNLFLNQINPGVTKQGTVIFTVPEGASGFKVQVQDTNYFTTGKAMVDLGF